MERHPVFNGHGSSKEKATGRIASCGQEVFLACGSTIRWADISQSDYVELETTGIDFQIERLLLNRSRSILVAAGQHKIVALFIPRASHIGKREVIKGLIIGEHHHLTSSIVDVKLHPLSAAGNAVVVLTENGILRLYDLNLSFTEPELQVSILKQHARGYGDLDESVAASFTFGYGGDGWTCFAVFVLLANGDIHTILPFMPDTCTLPHEYAATFEQHASIEAGTASAAGYTKLLTAIDHGVRLASGIAFTRPAKLLAPVVLGPCLQSPAPLELSTNEVFATSIMFIPSQPVNLLAVASQGKIDICLVGSLMPKQKASVILAVHETIQIAASPILEPLDECSFFARHEHGLHKIECRWLETLADAYETSDVLAESVMADGLSSTVTKLLDAEGNGTAGLATVEHDLEASLLVLSASTVHRIQLTTMSFEGLDLGVDNIEPDSPDARYKSLLSLPAYRLPSLPQGPRVAVPAALQGDNPLTSDIDTLRFVAKVATQVRKDIENLFHAALTLHRRLQLQIQEHERQRDKLADCSKTVKALSEADAHDARHAAVRERQAQLEARAAAMLTKLRHGNAPELSVAETRYFEELKRIQTHVHGHAGLLQRLKTAKQQFEVVSTAFERWNKAGKHSVQSISSPLKVTHIARLKGQLEGIDETLARTRSKLERLQRLSESGV
jgi:hypothetical protein